MLKHVGLQITNSDLKDFYITLLNGKIIREFSIDKETANNIFQINHMVDAYLILVEDFTLELFVHEINQNCKFNHICFETASPGDLMDRAKKMGYWTWVRSTERGKTYFIKDTVENTFEIKTK